jgi:hypothetical protein
MKVISIQAWDRFQHYKDRDPPWVKLYRDLLTSESWVLGTDSSRLVQVASVLLAARYGNRIPYRYDLIKKVANLEMSEKQFDLAMTHLSDTNFLEIQQVTEEKEVVAQHAIKPLATCPSETEAEQSKEKTEQSRAEQNSVGQSPDDAVARVFAHWRTVHGHSRATLDPKRRRVIREALKTFNEADLCESIAGYKNSAHHMGQNERSTVYDDIELFLRDSKHVEAGLRFARTGASPTFSSLTRRNVEATSEWIPPEMRNAAN